MQHCILHEKSMSDLIQTAKYASEPRSDASALTLLLARLLHRTGMRLFGFFSQPTIEPVDVRANPVAAFLPDLATTAQPVGEGCYALPDGAGGCRAWVQFIIQSHCTIRIHRLWTLRPGQGNGSALLRAVCAAADRHGVEITLKVLPFGRKPYPASRELLVSWYERHGFVGTHRKMVRQPMAMLVLH
jgi:GNAT superfamily N-acetyltransferase